MRQALTGVKKAVASLAVAGVALLGGCKSSTKPATTEPTMRPLATDIDPKKAEPDYWLDQPGAAHVTAASFDRLFNAAEGVARNRYFHVDQADRREGLIVSAPLTSKQFFEVWRNDTGTGRETLSSSLATQRRTLRYEFTKNPDGTFTVTPKVLIERYATIGHRVTNPAQAPAAFDPSPDESDPAYRHYPWDPTYWYAVGRDKALEKQIAEAIEGRVRD